MFKAGRYYFRKKSMSAAEPAKVRRVYIGTSRSLLSAMDDFINTHQSAGGGPPAECYRRFVEAEMHYPLIAC